MITLSNDNINIYFWKLNLKSSIKINELLESKSLDKINDNFDIKFKDKRAFGIHDKKPWNLNLTKHDWKTYMFNNLSKVNENIVEYENNGNQNTSNENAKIVEKIEKIKLFDENIFIDIDQKLDVLIQDKLKLELIEKYFISLLKVYIIIINISENIETQDEYSLYNLELKTITILL